jgi:hypothetical protein
MVGTLIATSLLGAAAVGTFAYAATAFAVNFAVSMIVTRIFADNPEQQQDMGVRQQVPPSAVNAIPIVYGNAYMGGTFVDAVLTTDQKTMYYVLAISSISPNGQFTFDTTDMYYGDRKITFDGTDQTKVVGLTDEAGNVDSKINGNLFISLYRSTNAGTITPLNGAAAPSTVMGGSDIAAGQRWTGTRQMNGLGFAIVKLVYNRDAGTTQLSPITFKVSHTLHGTGVAKPGDVWADYISNFTYGGAVQSVNVDVASAIALNAYSDELITFTNSSGAPSTQARYRINGVLDAGETVLSNIDRIMSACDSWMTYNAASGQWAVVINKAETTSYAFTDNNIVGDIRVSATDITSSINQVEARFPFKENRDQANFINIKTPTILLYPNEPVNKYSITYDLVNDSVQAHYLANRLLEQAREDLIVSFNTTYFGIQVDAGNVVSVTNSDYGWNAKLFRVMKVNEASLADGSLGARLELSEYNAQVYDDQTINQFAPVPNSGLPSAIFFSPLSAPTVSASNPASAIPNFNISIAIPATGRVTYSELYYTTAAVPSSSDWKLLVTANTIDGEPFTPSTTYVFANQILPTGASSSATYYFSYLVGNDLAKSDRSPISASFTWTPIANAGAFVDISGFTAFSKSETGTITPASVTLTAITNNVSSPTYAWTVTGATPSSGSSSTITITPTSVATSVVVTLVVNGVNLTSAITRQITMPIVNEGATGASGNKVATVFLYQWSSTTPGNPSGQSTYTWSPPGNATYTGGNGWQTSVPANPGTPLLKLWVASKEITDVATAITTTVSWSSGFSVYAGSENGADGVKTAEAIVYQWATTIPTISGSSTYDWASDAVTSAPTGWFTTISDTATAGQTLWKASVALTDSVTATTSTVNWATASILPFGYVGSTGAVGRIAYAASSTTLSTTPNIFTVTGDALPATGSWQAGLVWSSSVPVLTAGQSVWQSDGVFNPTNNQTIWEVPYLSSLKVGNLSAISTNTGSLTVSGNVTIGNFGNIRGGQTAYNTGTGFFLGYSGSAYKFSIGSSTVNMLWDGTAFTVNGAAIQGGTIQIGTGNTPSGNVFQVNSAGAFWVDNILGGVGNFSNFYINSSALIGNSEGSRSFPATAGFVASGNSAAGAHGLRGQNNNNGSAGLVGGANGYDFYADGSGTNYGPFTGNHDILLPIAQTLTEGTIVVDVQCIARNDWSNAIFEVAASTSANQARARGVFVGQLRPLSSVKPPAFIDYWIEVDNVSVPVMTAQYDAIKNDYWFGSMNSIGEGQIQVCGENGNISVDTLLVTSSTTGVAMAQSDDVIRSKTVAKAREAIVFASPTEVKIVACIYLGG